MLSSRPCRRDAFCLPLTDGFALRLGEISHHLQDHIPIERLFDTITFCTQKGRFCALLGAPLIDSGYIVCAYEKNALFRHLEETL